VHVLKYVWICWKFFNNIGFGLPARLPTVNAGKWVVQFMLKIFLQHYHLYRRFNLMMAAQDEQLHNINSKYEVKYNCLQKTELPANYFGNGQTLGGNIFKEFTQLQTDLINVERKTLERLHRKSEASEEILRKIEREPDFEETRLKMEIYVG
jgi:hypothetical protein